MPNGSPARILVLGAGKIGELIASLMRGDYAVRVADKRALWNVDYVGDLGSEVFLHSLMNDLITEGDVVISALPYHANPKVAEAVLDRKASYFDLTEDVDSTRRIFDISKNAVSGQSFVPQCGLAPGVVSILAASMCQKFDEVKTVKIRVGALPACSTTKLGYALTWSTEGLINEYLRPCEAIRNGKITNLQPLEGLERIVVDGAEYEAFNTSGGLGTLCQSLEGKVSNLDYKTIRHKGHCESMRLLLEELNMKDDLKKVLEKNVPTTMSDVVILYCSVIGQRGGQLVEDIKWTKVYGTALETAIQTTTASSVCAVVDLFLSNKIEKKPFIKQEEIPLGVFLESKFASCYAESFGAYSKAALQELAVTA